MVRYFRSCDISTKVKVKMYVKHYCSSISSSFFYYERCALEGIENKLRRDSLPATADQPFIQHARLYNGYALLSLLVLIGLETILRLVCNGYVGGRRQTFIATRRAHCLSLVFVSVQVNNVYSALNL